LAQNTQPDAKSNPGVRQSTNLSSPAIKVGTRQGNSLGRQSAVRISTSGSVREKCQAGDQFLKQQHYSQALHAYEEALSIEPRNFYACNGKGTAMYSQRNHTKAYAA